MEDNLWPWSRGTLSNALQWRERSTSGITANLSALFCYRLVMLLMLLKYQPALDRLAWHRKYHKYTMNTAVLPTTLHIARFVHLHSWVELVSFWTSVFIYFSKTFTSIYIWWLHWWIYTNMNLEINLLFIYFTNKQKNHALFWNVTKINFSSLTGSLIPAKTHTRWDN